MYNYTEISRYKEDSNTIYFVVIAFDGETYFKCFYNERECIYSRPAGPLTMVSRDINYIAIGAKKFKTKKGAMNYSYCKKH